MMLLLVQNKHRTKRERVENKTMPENNLFNLPETFTMCSICVVAIHIWSTLFNFIVYYKQTKTSKKIILINLSEEIYCGNFHRQVIRLNFPINFLLSCVSQKALTLGMLMELGILAKKTTDKFVWCIREMDLRWAFKGFIIIELFYSFRSLLVRRQKQFSINFVRGLSKQPHFR